MATLSQTDLALEILTPDDLGYSRIVYIDEFINKDPNLRFGNGASWARDDGALGKIYNIKRIYGRDELTEYIRLKDKELVKSPNGIIAIKLEGFKKNSKNQKIKKEIFNIINKQKCSVLSIGSQIEVDHKDGRKDNNEINSGKNQKLEDFQALSRSANLAKRQHCKECKATGIRFDAKQLGYSVSQWIGDTEYKNDCTGCYWYDPKRFNQEVSATYLKRYSGKGIILEIKKEGIDSWKTKIPLDSLTLYDFIKEETLQLIKNLKIGETLKAKNKESNEFIITRIE